jgi:hypothetical protein
MSINQFAFIRRGSDIPTENKPLIYNDLIHEYGYSGDFTLWSLGVLPFKIKNCSHLGNEQSLKPPEYVLFTFNPLHNRGLFSDGGFACHM